MGSYPYVTSSNTTISGIIAGLTLNPKNITETIGVVKAYTTRVGAGAFKTEDLGEYYHPTHDSALETKQTDHVRNGVGTKLQEVGREWGTSTGRRRRCGWSLNLTKLDVLDSFETIKVAIAYKGKSTELESYPTDHNKLDNAEVVYREMPGWKKPTTNARTYLLAAK
ncbi:P-loop containing nucleoside triphosphate hydrolase protein [Ilyonectria destructans]|nr:P-loop containing nucleoside triphosphate hydrolase protein [Ilyonectria destructans]